MFGNILKPKDKGNTGKDKPAQEEVLFDPGELLDELDDDKVVVELQPQIYAADGSIAGAEALSRYVDDDNNLIGPMMFLPILESASVVNQLDFAVVRQVTELLCRWRTTGRGKVGISVNFSRSDFMERGFLEKINAYFTEYGVDKRDITIEVRESSIVENYDYMYKRMQWLHNQGYKVTIEDFGREGNLLFRLGALPVDAVKFDREVLLRAIYTERGLALMQHVVSGLMEAGYDVICSGVETEEQKDAVMSAGIQRIQGFYYDRPMSVESFESKYFR